jgi:hypothetical protein
VAGRDGVDTADLPEGGLSVLEPKCAWCFARRLEGQLECSGCGVALMPPPGAGPGPAPAAPPRRLPRSVEQRLRWLSQPGMMQGAALLFSVPLGIALLAGGLMLGRLAVVAGAAVVLAALGGPGIRLVLGAWQRAEAHLRLFREGRAAQGTLEAVELDRSVRIRGRSPWRLQYRYEVDGGTHRATQRVWDRTFGERRPGEPVHVLYLAEAPDHAALYPFVW